MSAPAPPAAVRYWTKPHTVVGIALAISMPAVIGFIVATSDDFAWGRALGALAVFGGTYMSGLVGGMVLQGSITEGWRKGAEDALVLADKWRTHCLDEIESRPHAEGSP